MKEGLSLPVAAQLLNTEAGGWMVQWLRSKRTLYQNLEFESILEHPEE